MFKRILQNFVVSNEKEKTNKFIPIIFDFVSIAIISLSVNSFILNDKSSYLAQKYFGVFSVLLMSTHWYVQSIFRDKYQKDKYVFIQLNFTAVFSMALMAVGLSLMVFRLNQKVENQDFLKWFSVSVYIFGLILSRFTVFLEYFLALIANFRNPVERELIMYKVVTRAIEVILAIVQLILLVILQEVELLIYIFMPIYFFLEFLGNNLNLRKRKADNYILTIAYVKARYRRLSTLFISSIFISMITQIAYYLKTDDFIKPIAFFTMEFSIVYFLFNLYVRVSYNDEPRISTSNLVKMSIISPLISASLTVFGGFLINSSSSHNILIGRVFIFTLAIIHFLIGLIYSTHKNISRSELREAIMIHVITPIILIAFGIFNIYFKIDLWIILVIITCMLLVESIAHWLLTNYLFNKEKSVAK